MYFDGGVFYLFLRGKIFKKKKKKKQKFHPKKKRNSKKKSPDFYTWFKKVVKNIQEY